ncbi:MAG: EamA family transporter [candidate division Zixibacteria bacterium]|nr:EamA family transporter [candidate division Zixibacteria bacterium]
MEERINPPPTRNHLLSAILIQQLIASLVYPVAKVGLAEMEAFTLAFFRFTIASVVLLAIVKSRRHDLAIERKDYPRIVLLGILIIPLNQTLFLVGQAMTAAGHGAFLFATTPLFVFLLARIHLKERTTVRRLTGIVMGLLGVGLIMWSGLRTAGTEYLLGDSIIFVAVIAWAYYSILGKDLVRKYGALRITAYALSSGAALYFPFGLYRAIAFDYSGVTYAAWLSVGYLAVGLSVIVYLIWYWLLKYMDASRAAVFQNIQPVVASITAYFFLGEQIGAAFVIGGLVVMAGVVLSET